jgi:hypothetical protein
MSTVRPEAPQGGDRVASAATINISPEFEAMTHGTGNAFADLGYPDAEARRTDL